MFLFQLAINIDYKHSDNIWSKNVFVLTWGFGMLQHASSEVTTKYYKLKKMNNKIDTSSG